MSQLMQGTRMLLPMDVSVPSQMAQVFDAMLEHNLRHACDGRLPTIDEVGGAALYFLSHLSAGATGQIHYVDHGVCIHG